VTALADRTVGEIFEGAASVDPSPGAGSVMALAGMWGLALALKAVRISRRHGRASDAALAAEPELERLAGLLRQDAEDDAAGFQAYVAAVRRPRSDPGREAAVSQAAAATAETSVRTLEHARAALELCRGLAGGVAGFLDADLQAAVALLQAAARTAGQDAVQNAQGVRSGPVREQVLGRVARTPPP